MDAEAMEAAILRQIKGMGNMTGSGGSFTDDVQGFLHAIDWTEPFLKGLIAFHMAVWAIVLLTRRHNELQMALLCAVLGAVYFAERINGLAAEHWRAFASQNYFDNRGVFVAVLYCTPLLCAAFFILINALRTTAALLVQVKRKELQVKNKASRRAAREGDETSQESRKDK